MKKSTVSFLVAVSALAFMAGCGNGTKESPEKSEAAEENVQDYQEETDGAAAESFAWLPAGVERQEAETEPNEELRQLIVDYYEIPDYELADSRYYYSYVDLDSDGKNEIFAVVAGSYTSGSGGSSALWCEEQEGVLQIKQAYTLVNIPIIVEDNEEGGPKKMIVERSGGGAATEYVELICTDGVYNSVSEAEPAADLKNLQGVAILCNDMADDLETGNYLTLEEPQQ